LGVDTIGREYENYEITTTSDLYLNFRPQESFGAEEIIQQMVGIMKKHDLSESSSSPFFSSRYVFENTSLICEISGNENFARLNCASNSKLDNLAAMNKAVIDAHNQSSTEKIDKGILRVFIEYQSKSNTNQHVVHVYATAASTSPIESILSKDSEEDWMKINITSTEPGGATIQCENLEEWQLLLFEEVQRVQVVCS